MIIGEIVEHKHSSHFIKGDRTFRSVDLLQLENLLKDSAYKKVRWNLTSRVEPKRIHCAEGVYTKAIIIGKKSLAFAHQFSSPPQIYGLPKIDKEGILLWPIMAAIESQIHQSARELARIRSPLAGKSSSHVRNSATKSPLTWSACSPECQ